MPTFFGLSAMPTTLLNAALGVARDRSVPVRGPDRVAVVSPMYNEEAGAERALTSLLNQDLEPHELAVSINGGTDRTYDVVTSTLVRFGFVRGELGSAPGFSAGMERWQHPERALQVLVFVYRQQTAKSEAVNNIVTCPVLESERMLVVDGDTVFETGFVRALSDQFYRLRWQDGRPVIEDYALQSGAVTSYLPPDTSRLHRFIAAGRSAEYAFAGVIRRGQARTFGRSGVWGSSRLFTVVGCGFVARRDVLPMPPDTQTEDHDLTLAAQMTATRLERLSAAELDHRGFRAVVDGAERRLTEIFDRHDAIELRHSGNARFVGDALMYTDDPAHVGGYLHQIERWNGGGIQNALKRLWGDRDERRLTPNVRFTVLAAQLENVLGLLLLLVFPALLALGLSGALDLTSLARNFALWVGIDLAATAAMTFAGFRLQARESGLRGLRANATALARTVRSWLPYMALKVANPVSFVAAATHAVPAFLNERKARRHRDNPTLGVAWERPTVRSVDRRTIHTAASMVATLAAVFASILVLAPSSSADQVATVHLLHATARVSMAEHDGLPLAQPATVTVARTVRSARRVPARLTVAALGPTGSVASGQQSAPLGPTTVVLRPPSSSAQLASAATVSVAAGSGLSSFCRAAYLAQPAAAPQLLPGTAARYRPLSNWELLMLGRLAPLEPYLEQASTAYDVPSGLLLRVLVNESYLDPLAVGETGDKGLSQMTSDALTLLRAVSDDHGSALYNPHLLGGDFNVFNPDFSVCAGAAKLRWAMTRPAARDDADAYALYINPVYGLTRDGNVAPALADAVGAMQRLAPLVRTLGSAYAAYRADPTSVAAPERQLLAVSADVAAGRIDLSTAYRRSRDLVASDGVNDGAVYQAVLDRLYPAQRAALATDARASASRR